MLLLGSTDADLGKLGKIHFTELESNKVEKAKAYYQPHAWSIVDNIPGQLESLEVIMLEPFKSDTASQKSSAVGGSKPPLVVFPHGGPHAAFSNEFVMLPLVLVGLGFTVACGNVVTPMISIKSKKSDPQNCLLSYCYYADI
jgi:acylaminoacyl-peptidase